MSATALAVAAAALIASAGCRGDADKVEHFDGLMEWDGLGPYRQVGKLIDGEKHGVWHAYDPDTGELLVVEHWRRGVQHGPMLVFEEGRLLFDWFYWDGELNGRMRGFIDGELEELGWARDNRRDGVWCYWDDGRLRRIREYSLGTIVWRRSEKWPRRPCPHLEGAGRRHADPRDRSYQWPRPKRGPVYRPF